MSISLWRLRRKYFDNIRHSRRLNGSLLLAAAFRETLLTSFRVATAGARKREREERRYRGKGIKYPLESAWESLRLAEGTKLLFAAVKILGNAADETRDSIDVNHERPRSPPPGSDSFFTRHHGAKDSENVVITVRRGPPIPKTLSSV